MENGFLAVFSRTGFQPVGSTGVLACAVPVRAGYRATVKSAVPRQDAWATDRRDACATSAVFLRLPHRQKCPQADTAPGEIYVFQIRLCSAPFEKLGNN